ncbi:MAG: tRNA 2-thiouridine(34) synthase MnmA [Coriobacteriia bacterium]
MRVWVALSGGVDSAVAAASTRDSGAEVTGVTLDLGLGNSAISEAAEVAASLGIPHRVLDVRAAFEERVIAPFVRAYAGGSTPNPCVVCNEHIKLGMLLEAARESGAERLATGHYARIVETGDGLRIARAVDPLKDQSYFLYRVGGRLLSHIEFPLGSLTKAEVRARAAALGLSVAERAESQDVCFLSGVSAGAFVCGRIPGACAPGPVLDVHGREIGTHDGICHFTVGQRKGLPGGPGPFFVTEVDPERNAVIAGTRQECETSRATAVDAVWSGQDRRHLTVCVRARSAAVPATVVRSDERLEIAFEEPVCAAPGQAAVCYDGDVVVGGGAIARERIR